MKIRLAYIEEPPFYWTAQDGTVTGADIELADTVLRAIGVTAIEHVPTSFDQFLPGVQKGSWDMNVPIFITPERAEHVAFSVPVWALGDGFLVRSGNPKALHSYAGLAAQDEARLGVIAGQVQIKSAQACGVADHQFVVFRDQPEAIAALTAGQIDAFAATAIGCRTTTKHNPKIQAVTHKEANGAKLPIGGFSFAKGNHRLLDAVNTQLRRHLGSAEHRANVYKFGLTTTEIDPVVER
jgi:polar amino acid transport system substrate-binding protein